MKNSLKPEKRKKVVLLDFASEKNRGDAAMQVSLIELSQKYFPDAELSVVTVFGTNQYPECLAQFDHTYPEYKNLVHYVGGLFTTHDAISDTRVISNKFLERLQRTVHLVGVYFFILLALARIPVPIWSWMLGVEKRRTLSILRESDYVIWNGRNFRGYTVLGELLHILRLLVHPLFCIGLRKPMVCLGASVWELKGGLSRCLMLFAFNRCKLVTLREQFSYEHVQKLVSNRKTATVYTQVPDLSLYILGQVQQSDTSDAEDYTVAVTLVGEREVGSADLYQTYIKKHQQLVTALQELYNARFLVVPQVIFEAESNAKTIGQVFSAVPQDRYRVIEKPLTVPELVNIYRNSQILVASRMHSAIFALTQSVPVVAIAYDEGAKWNILTDMGLPQTALIKMSELSETNLVQVFSEVYERKQDITGHVQQVLTSRLYPAVEDQMAEARRLMDINYER